jgi:hypothetical protein
LHAGVGRAVLDPRRLLLPGLYVRHARPAPNGSAAPSTRYTGASNPGTRRLYSSPTGS